jgi:hypothetical protein
VITVLNIYRAVLVTGPQVIAALHSLSPSMSLPRWFEAWRAVSSAAITV